MSDLVEVYPAGRKRFYFDNTERRILMAATDAERIQKTMGHVWGRQTEVHTHAAGNATRWNFNDLHAAFSQVCAAARGSNSGEMQVTIRQRANNNSRTMHFSAATRNDGSLVLRSAPLQVRL